MLSKALRAGVAVPFVFTTFSYGCSFLNLIDLLLLPIVNDHVKHDVGSLIAPRPFTCEAFHHCPEQRLLLEVYLSFPFI